MAGVIKPKGLAISPGGKTLYVAESHGDPELARKPFASARHSDGPVGKSLYRVKPTVADRAAR